MKVIDQPKQVEHGRKPNPQYDAIAAAILTLAPGKALPLTIPAGKSFKQFKESLTGVLQRRSIRAKIVKVNETEIAVWAREENHE